MANKYRQFLLSVSVAAAALAGVAANPLPFSLSPLDEGYLSRARQFARSENWQATADQLSNLNFLFSSAIIPAEEALFLKAAAAFHNADPAAERILEQFIAAHSASPSTTEARLMLADYLFFAGDYQAAMRAYDEIEPNMLAGSTLALYTYRRALCMLKSGYLPESRKLFASLRSNPKYAEAAEFYDAYIDYAEGNLKSAYDKFNRIPDKGVRGLESDYYITQILYARGEYDRAASEALRLLSRNPAPELLPETQRVAALSLFKTDRKSEAATHLENYVAANPDNAAVDAVYALGTIYYDRGDLVSAADMFGRLTDDRTDIAQSAWLYLGQIALQQDDDSTAALAFSKAADMAFDHNVSETALYNFATSTARGGNIPFRSGIEQLELFNRNFPQSRYSSDVDAYLASAYFNAKDYEKALESVSKISNPSPSVKAARQKILYEVGMQRLINGDATGAKSALGEAASSQSDKGVSAQSYLWLGDALYSEGDYAAAEKAYQSAIRSGNIGDNLPLANYNLGYTLLHLHRYREALPYLRSASESLSNPSQRRDAEMRVADCLYYTGQYDEARTLFAKLSADAGSDAEYAAMRRATILGRNGDVDGKIKILRGLADDNSLKSSRWMPEILERLATAYAEKGDDAKAASVYERYLTLYPTGSKAAANTLALSHAYGKTGQSVKSEIEYKRVIETWPGSEEARQADAELRRIYASEGKLQEYAQYLKTVPGGFSLDAAEMERLSFEAAEDAWNDSGSTELVKEYLDSYPNGADADAAWSIMAQSYHEAGNRPEALSAYRRLLQYGPGEYYLTAMAGIMRNSDKEDEIIRCAQALKAASGASPDLAEEAEFFEAYTLSGSRNAATRTAAISALSSIASNPNSVWGARAAVTLGQIYLNSSQPSKAEKILSEFVDSGTPHQYWLARGYIALADAYTALNKGYLARQYLESLRDNYPGSELDIHNMIASRLKNLK